MGQIRWERGGDAELVMIVGERIMVRSTMPFAPGTPVDGRLESGTLVRMKVHRCKRGGRYERQERQGSPSAPEKESCLELFEIEARLVDATRDTRAELAALSQRR